MLRALIRSTLAALLLAAPAAQAAVLDTYTFDYGAAGRDPGTGSGFGSDGIGGDYMLVRDGNAGPEAPGRLTDSFSLAALAGAVIDSITLTITYARVNQNEAWYFDIYGSDPSGFFDNRFTILPTAQNTLGTATLNLDAATDALFGIDAFAHSLAQQSVSFGFEEQTGGNDNFRLYDAVLTVNGTAAVPIPAPGVLLIAALGGLGLWRRRQRAATTAAA